MAGMTMKMKITIEEIKKKKQRKNNDYDDTTE